MECGPRIYQLATLLTIPFVAVQAATRHLSPGCQGPAGSHGPDIIGIGACLLVGMLISGSPGRNALRNGDGLGDTSRILKGRLGRARERVPAGDNSCLSAAMRASTDAIVLVDMDLKITDTSDAAIQLLGYRNSPEIIGLSVLNLLMPEAREIARRDIEDTFGGGISRRRQHSGRRADGTPVPVEVSAAVIDGAAGVPSGFVCVMRDLTEEMKYRDTLIGQAEFLRTMIDTIPHPVFYKDADGRYLGCNSAFAEFVGVAEGEIVGRTIHEITPRHIADTYYDMDAEMYENPGRQHYEWKVKNKCGEERNVLLDKATFDDASGKIKGVIGVLTDITDRKRMEAALHHDRAELQVIFEAVPDAVIFTDKSMRITMTNRAFVQLFGHRGDDVYGTHVDLLRAKADAQRGDGAGPPATGPSDAPIHQEAEYRKMNGETFLGDTVTTPVRNDRGNIMGMLVIIRDVTESKRADESAGTLAADGAHDFNRKYPKDQSTIDLGEMVQKMLGMLSTLIGDSISITSRVDADLWAVRGDRAGLEQVLMNLVINARDAMPRGGQITICAENIGREDMDRALLRKAGTEASPLGFVRLAVTDDGTGMNQETLSHVFEPCFSTKKFGQGSALGLSVAYATVQHHGGWIDVCSKPEEGTAFWVYLPALRALSQSSPAAGPVAMADHSPAGPTRRRCP